ncbi:MAG: efflux RND transporter periplasmic adaptor subunit [Bacteroidales bacterium]|nr:efflux RND transporter periplasmic adaptor subunit [Bacteroidales bacterium]
MKIKISKKDMGKAAGILIIGMFIGWVFFGGNEKNTNTETIEQHDHADESSTTWTCSMHPQIKQDKPGNCPICGMELIPLDDGGDDDEELSLSEIKMSKAAMKIAEVQTVFIEKKVPYKEVYFPGKVKPDERNISELTARFGGRIEKLYVNFTGQKVRKGEKLTSIYSPDLVTAQKELFEATKFKKNNPAFYRAARNKLKLWDLTDKQIDDIETSGEPLFYFDVLSPITGTVMMRHIAIGDYVKEGTPLFEVINLNHLWVMFEAYESDIPWVKMGDKIDFTIKSIPGKTFTSTVTFIDPVVDQRKRVAYVRTELNNKGDLLKPGMFASGILKTMLPNSEDAIVIPKTAILWTGKRAIVYVKVPDKEMVFEHREIELGEDAGSYYVVAGGLEEGEEVATNGVFKIDAASQLLSKQSMMTPAGGKSSLGGHAGMDMGGGDKKATTEMDMPAEEMKAGATNPEFKKQLGNLILQYLAMKDAFVDSDEQATEAAAQKALDALAKVDMGLLKGDAHNHWMKLQKPIKNNLSGIIQMKGIEMKRSHFSIVSDNLSEAIKAFGYKSDGITDLYLEFCPMALGNKGAYWISETKKIRNPYFGEAMMTCGEVKATY